MEGRIGDRIAQALAAVGISEDRVTAWLGRPCGCAERREKLNQLGYWASRVLRGERAYADRYLSDIIDPGRDPPREAET